MKSLKSRKFIIPLIIVIVLGILLWQTAIIEIFSFSRFDVNVETNTIALTFDDGPDLGEEELLKALNDAGIQVTLFWTLEKIQMMQESHPEEFKSILELINEGGHEIGIHGFLCNISWNPIDRFFILSEEENIVELRKKFLDTINMEPRLYRSHGPRSGRSFYNSLKESGVELTFGSLNYQIGVRSSVDQYTEHLSKAEAGNIISGHDSRNCELDSGMPAKIIGIIPEISGILKENNISIVTVSELLETP